MLLQMQKLTPEDYEKTIDSLKRVTTSYAEAFANDPQAAFHQLGSYLIQFGL